jgi:hypothetical protein
VTPIIEQKALIIIPENGIIVSHCHYKLGKAIRNPLQKPHYIFAMPNNFFLNSGNQTIGCSNFFHTGNDSSILAGPRQPTLNLKR